MTDQIGPIVNLVTGVLPSIMALIRDAHGNANPGALPLTDADVFAALAAAVESSVVKDEAWKAAHPTTPAG
jgi:hypothetical protein